MPKRTVRSATVRLGTPARENPITLDEQALRQAIYDTAAQFLGKTERTNHNDAPWITRINKFNHLPSQALYCASGLYYAYAKNGAWLTVKSVGYVKVYFRDKAKIVYQRGARGNQRIGPPPKKMDFVSLYASHVEGLADDRWNDDADYVMTIGFNTTGGTGTKGGCYLNRRRKSEIKAIANHLTPYLEQWKP
ncbi:hypothetical protein LQ777_10495 [Spirosoma oryzicola]|nr:hypothetical protein LQ777_10495 [Spirosoma oryzicola]